jgi:leucyl aminopeptidase
MSALKLWDVNSLLPVDISQKLTLWFVDDWNADAPEGLKTSLKPQGFSGQLNELALEVTGEEIGYHYGLGARAQFQTKHLRSLGDRLKDGAYELIIPEGLRIDDVCLFSEIGFYRDERFHNRKKRDLRLWSSKVPSENVITAVCAHHLVCDLISSPANHLGPQELAQVALSVAQKAGAEANIIMASEELKTIAPAIFAVGEAAALGREPCVFEMRWQSSKPKFKLAIVGKGICFDTGGLNLKSGSGMGLMKKDMGGAAHALALCQWIMNSGLEVDLHLVLALAENSVSGAAMRPGDVIKSAKGISIEIGNTDAEGRLVLADALHMVASSQPDLTLCYATLTGAARTALGPEIVPFFTDDEAVAAKLTNISQLCSDPLWRLPFWDGYEEALNSDIADIKNDPSSWAQAGSIMAGLFLRRFAPINSRFVHFDLYGWNPRQRPGYGLGPEVQSLRASYEFIKSFQGNERSS